MIQTAPSYELVSKPCVVCKRIFKVLSTSEVETCSRGCLATHTGNPKLAWIHAQPMSNGKRHDPMVIEPEVIGGEDDSEKYAKELDAIDVPVEDATPARDPKPGGTPGKPKDSGKKFSHLKITEQPPEVPAAPEAVPVPEPSPIEPVSKLSSEDKRWQEYVDRAKSYISKMAQHRLDIAMLALEVCDIRWGGGDHWANHEGTYTLKRFAEEIGLNPKTLSGWVRVKRNVIDKLIEAKEPIDIVTDWSALVRTADRTKHSASAQDVLKHFKKWDKKKPFNQDRYTLSALRRFRSFEYFLHNKADPSKMSETDMDEMGSKIKSIQKWIRDNRSDFV